VAGAPTPTVRCRDRIARRPADERRWWARRVTPRDRRSRPVATATGVAVLGPADEGRSVCALMSPGESHDRGARTPPRWYSCLGSNVPPGVPAGAPARHGRCLPPGCEARVATLTLALVSHGRRPSRSPRMPLQVASEGSAPGGHRTQYPRRPSPDGRRHGQAPGPRPLGRSSATRHVRAVPPTRGPGPRPRGGRCCT
jgi:hypothetical protein